MRLTIVGPSVEGGISLYCHHQANAFAELGVEVTLICTPEHCTTQRVAYRRLAILPALPKDHTRNSKATRTLRQLANIMAGARRTAQALAAEPPQPVLTHFSEYLAPFWAWRFHRLRRRGFTFHTVLHDPKRNYRVGPAAWHVFSVNQAFKLYNTIFVHANERGDAPAHLPLVTVPHGVFETPATDRSRAEVRESLEIPQDAPLLIQFGFIRDYKNLDLVIRALARVSGVYLLVAGAEHGGSRPASFYKALADEVGVADRCRFLIDFHDSVAAANLLTASDALCLTYSANFVSASGVLAIAVHHRLPALVSCGLLEMRTTVETYGIGRWVEPDSVESIVDGLVALLSNPPAAEWGRYERERSWLCNAELILAAVTEAPSGQTPVR